MSAVLLPLEMMLVRIRGPRTEDRGASLVEYALLLALIAIVCMIALEFLGGETGSKYTGVGSSVSEAGS